MDSGSLTHAAGAAHRRKACRGDAEQVIDVLMEAASRDFYYWAGQEVTSPIDEQSINGRGRHHPDRRAVALAPD